MRRALAAILFAFPLILGGCDQGKPSEESCREAVEKIRSLTGLERSDIGADPDSMIRSCRANSNRESVRCVLAAKSLDDLEKCEGEVGKKLLEEEKRRAAEKAEKAEAE